MSVNTPITRSQPKPSPSDEIVELRPPAAQGFSGTAWFKKRADAVLIAELIRRGYSRVDSKDDPKDDAA